MTNHRQKDGEFWMIRNVDEMEEPPVLCKGPNNQITVDSHSDHAFIIQSVIENNSIRRELEAASTRWPVRENRKDNYRKESYPQKNKN